MVNGNGTLKFLLCALLYFYPRARQGRCMGVLEAVDTEGPQQPGARERRRG